MTDCAATPHYRRCALRFAVRQAFLAWFSRSAARAIPATRGARAALEARQAGHRAEAPTLATRPAAARRRAAMRADLTPDKPLPATTKAARAWLVRARVAAMRAPAARWVALAAQVTGAHLPATTSSRPVWAHP